MQVLGDDASLPVVVGCSPIAEFDAAGIVDETLSTLTSPQWQTPMWWQVVGHKADGIMMEHSRVGDESTHSAGIVGGG